MEKCINVCRYLLSMAEEISIDIILASIKNLYDNFHKTAESIKKYNRKYDVETSDSLFFLETVLNKSYEQIVNNLYTNDLSELSSLYTTLSYKIDQLHKMSLSEIAHKKLKQIDFEIKNPYFYNNSRKEFREIKNELNELDDKTFNEKQLTENTISEYQKIIIKLTTLEDILGDEKKSGLYSKIPKVAYILAPILISIEGFILAEYIIFNPYIPLVGYILVLFLVYCMLKSPTDFSLLYKKSLNIRNIFLHFTILAAITVYGLLAFSNIFQGLTFKIPFLIIFLVFVYLYLYFIKMLIDSERKAIIDNEFDILHDKYLK